MSAPKNRFFPVRVLLPEQKQMATPKNRLFPVPVQYYQSKNKNGSCQKRFIPCTCPTTSAKTKWQRPKTGYSMPLSYYLSKNRMAAAKNWLFPVPVLYYLSKNKMAAAKKTGYSLSYYLSCPHGECSSSSSPWPGQRASAHGTPHHRCPIGRSKYYEAFLLAGEQNKEDFLLVHPKFEIVQYSSFVSQQLYFFLLKDYHSSTRSAKLYRAFSLIRLSSRRFYLHIC